MVLISLYMFSVSCPLKSWCLANFGGLFVSLFHNFLSFVVVTYLSGHLKPM